MVARGPTDEIHNGRWLSPDPLGGDVTNPQSLNRYAYALNNPTTLTDPLGLCAGCKLLEVGYADLGDEFNDIFNYDSEGGLWFGTPVSWTGSPAAYPGPGGGGGGAPPKPNIITWQQLQKLVHENNESNFCDDLIDCIVFNESTLGGGFDANAVPLGPGGRPLNPKIYSARGLMQVTGTATKELAVPNVYDQLFNPAINIQAASAYLMIDVFQFHHGNLRAGLNAYGEPPDYADKILNCVKQLQAGNVPAANSAAHGR